MDIEKIPKIISDKATEQGYNSVEFIGYRNGAQAFSVGFVPKDGIPIPTGMPTIYLLKDGVVQVVCGIESLRMLRPF